MKLLAVDASGQVASVAIITEEGIRAEYSVDYQKTHSQTLLPMIDEILRMTETDKKELDAIAVSEGPGSFTGLRIGAATVKGLAAALDKPVIPVPTLEMLAANFMGAGELLCPMMDARRNQVYTGLYRFEGNQILRVSGQRACALEEILQEINAQNRPVILLGDAIDVYREEISRTLTCPYRFAEAHQKKQRAGSLAVLAFHILQNAAQPSAPSEAEARLIPGSEMVPEYLRVSQAERERSEKQAASAGGSL